MAGTVLVHKVAGAAAERGMSLEEIVEIAEWTASRVGTLGVGSAYLRIGVLSGFFGS